MFGWMLEILGYEARMTCDAEDALRIAAQFCPDVVMLDLSLNGVSGHDVCQRMKKIPGLEECIFIAQSGWDQPEHVERSMKSGFQHHWVKPVSMERVETFLASVAQKVAA